jgi:SAM-dependent methyltransferase
MDAINRQAWRARESISGYGALEGYTDEGERVALERIAQAVRNEPILDLGVGGGRTVPLLRAISEDYTAIDYTPQLVAVCRNKYPGLHIFDGDARDLSRFADGSFALVVFSFNGIDSVSPPDRTKILGEVHRVLRPGGIFLFSTHNQRGPGHDEPFTLGVHWTRNPLKLAARMARALGSSARTLSNYRRYSRLNYRAEGHSIMNAAALNHGIMIHYITTEQQCAQLAQAGFEATPEIYGLTGQAVTTGNDTSGLMWFHFIARKSKAAGAPAT